MRRLSLTLVVTVLLAGCAGNDRSGEAGASSTAAAAPAATSTSPGSVADADRAAILKTLALTADGKGQVLNECGERITPQLLPVDVGDGVGSAVLVVMTGGPQQASCYGDGPGLTLMRHAAGGWNEIYSSRGGSLVIMKETHNDARDIVFGGPGFSHPLFTWNGTTYVRSNREVPDDGLEGTTILP